MNFNKKLVRAVTAMTTAATLLTPVMVSAAPTQMPVIPPTNNAVQATNFEAMFASMFNADEYAMMYPEVLKLVGNDKTKLFQHYLRFGIFEGKRPSVRVTQQSASIMAGQFKSLLGPTAVGQDVLAMLNTLSVNPAMQNIVAFIANTTQEIALTGSAPASVVAAFTGEVAQTPVSTPAEAPKAEEEAKPAPVEVKNVINGAELVFIGYDEDGDSAYVLTYKDFNGLSCKNFIDAGYEVKFVSKTNNEDIVFIPEEGVFIVKKASVASNPVITGEIQILDKDKKVIATATVTKTVKEESPEGPSIEDPASEELITLYQDVTSKISLVNSLSTSLKEAKEEYDAAKETLKELEGTLTSKLDDLEAKKTELATAKEELKDAQKNLADFLEELGESLSEQSLQEYNALKLDLELKELALKGAKEEYDAAKTASDEAKSAYDAAKAISDAADTKCSNLSNEIQSLADDISDAKLKIERIGEQETIITNNEASLLEYDMNYETATSYLEDMADTAEGEEPGGLQALSNLLTEKEADAILEYLSDDLISDEDVTLEEILAYLDSSEDEDDAQLYGDLLTAIASAIIEEAGEGSIEDIDDEDIDAWLENNGITSSIFDSFVDSLASITEKIVNDTNGALIEEVTDEQLQAWAGQNKDGNDKASAYLSAKENYDNESTKVNAVIGLVSAISEAKEAIAGIGDKESLTSEVSTKTGTKTEKEAEFETETGKLTEANNTTSAAKNDWETKSAVTTGKQEAQEALSRQVQDIKDQMAGIMSEEQNATMNQLTEAVATAEGKVSTAQSKVDEANTAAEAAKEARDNQKKTTDQLESAVNNITTTYNEAIVAAENAIDAFEAHGGLMDAGVPVPPTVVNNPEVEIVYNDTAKYNEAPVLGESAPAEAPAETPAE